ncbi:mevalonate kinase [Kitasatospora sp. NPDC089913]|uniref:mevalonate kinase n=1 Tax=Kitasatospora sp. NPDC089913 TaxID=3364080 RepID=UPI00381ECF6C
MSSHMTDHGPVTGKPVSARDGRAWAKVILAGEHAVVHGAPALVLPFPQLSVTATAQLAGSSRTRRDTFSFTMDGSRRPAPGAAEGGNDAMCALASAFRAAVGVAEEHRVVVEIDCTVPPGRGLGSSAACAQAALGAMAQLFRVELTSRLAFGLVQVAEQVTHGRASGVDAMAVATSTPLLFRAGTARELVPRCEGLLIVADSGTTGHTREAVELLARGFASRSGSREAFVREATDLTEAAERAFTGGRIQDLGTNMNSYHVLLRNAGLSTDAIDAMVRAAVAAGSPGAKITGGGMGGCVIALAHAGQAQEVARALASAGAVRTWSTPLGNVELP